MKSTVTDFPATLATSSPRMATPASHRFPVDLGEAALWLGYKGDARQAKRSAKDALMAMQVVEGVDYILRGNVPPQTSTRGGHNAEEIRLTSECFKKFCLRAGTKRAERVRA